MDLPCSNSSDLDAIARNLSALDLAHLAPEEAAAYEHELSAVAALNDALTTTDLALKLAKSPLFWQRLHPMLSDAAALLSSQIAPLLDLNAERHFELSETPAEPPLIFAAPSLRTCPSNRALADQT